MIRPFNYVLVEIYGFNILNHMAPWDFVFFFVLILMFLVVNYFTPSCSSLQQAIHTSFKQSSRVHLLA